MDLSQLIFSIEQTK